MIALLEKYLLNDEFLLMVEVTTQQDTGLCSGKLIRKFNSSVRKRNFQ